MSIFKKRKKM